MRALFAFLLALLSSGKPRDETPIVGLAGIQYRRAYVRALEPMRVQGEPISCAELVVLVALLQFGRAKMDGPTTQVCDRQVDVTWRTGSHGYHEALRLAGPQAEQPRLKVERDSQTLLDKGDLSVPPNVAG